MSWEVRHNGKYYYRRRKTEDGLLREYVGRGPLAEFIADLDILERAERFAQQRQEMGVRRQWQAADLAFRTAHEMLNAVTSTHLRSLGYRRHNRGPWRRNRQLMEEVRMETGPTESAAADAKVNPELALDMLGRAEIAWVQMMAGGDEALFASLLEELAQSRQGLHEDGDTALVSMLVRRVALCELQVAFADLTYARRADDITLAQAKFLLSRQRTMQQRLLQSTRALAQLRKLVAPSRRPSSRRQFPD